MIPTIFCILFLCVVTVACGVNLLFLWNENVIVIFIIIVNILGVNLKSDSEQRKQKKNDLGCLAIKYFQ